MIRDVIVHLFNDQPVLVDMFEMPTAVDTGLICTHLRTLDGRQPVFIENSGSRFYFPYQHIRFIEIGAQKGPSADAQTVARGEPVPPAEPVEEELEIDEDFLRRIREA